MRSNASLKYYIAVEREKEEGEEEKKVKRKNEIGSGGARKREREGNKEEGETRMSTYCPAYHAGLPGRSRLNTIHVVETSRDFLSAYVNSLGRAFTSFSISFPPPPSALDT